MDPPLWILSCFDGSGIDLYLRKIGDPMVEAGKKYRMTKAERRAQEKIRRAQETSVSCAGKTLLEKLNDELDKAMKDYLSQKDKVHDLGSELPHDWPELAEEVAEELAKLKQKRGLVRGIAIGVGMIENPYELKRSTKLAEKESVERCRMEKKSQS